MTTITRSIEIDAGHRVPGHLGKCRNIHGHRYKIEVTVRGLVQKEGAEAGMVVDFGRLKDIMVDVLMPFDHTLMLSIHEKEYLKAVDWNAVTEQSQLCGIIRPIPFSPTAENLARYWCGLLARNLTVKNVTLDIVNVRVYETPNCWADYPGTHQP